MILISSFICDDRSNRYYPHYRYIIIISLVAELAFYFIVLSFEKYADSIWIPLTTSGILTVLNLIYAEYITSVAKKNKKINSELYLMQVLKPCGKGYTTYGTEFETVQQKAKLPFFRRQMTDLRIDLKRMNNKNIA
ncbi:hypothetical protein MsAg5_12200 [Methanosarcinaceae archaeon Ag5]|uniref:Uncharacterized protein n=1 Tax=Methanolapillus africanus TaxID=3028297 RepID=A0AAE4MK74_9EURY|nr:hypothetical protein [Methanosarcinaceae archaeon Ag5]